MAFHSILFERAREEGAEAREMPPFFRDLNLDQVLARLTSGREEYQLEPFFCAPPEDLASIAYRHEIMQDLEREAVRRPVEEFARQMRAMREHLARAEELYYEYQKASWFLDAVEIYCEAVRSLADSLRSAGIRSRGLTAFGRYLTEYLGSEDFRSLADEVQRLKEELAKVHYTVHIRGSRVTVGRYDGEPDYSAEVQETFQKFAQGAAKDYRISFPEPVEMNHVEATILDLVARLYPEAFLALRQFHERRRGYLDPALSRFDREIQFYLAYLELMGGLRSAGLKFCYPQLSERSKEVYAYETFDLALAEKLVRSGDGPPVCNDFFLKGPERILVVSGPNQGGKTTFARTFGQLHYLAKLGYPVPGSEARLLLCDRIFTHFEREEHIENLRGKLEDELARIHEILREATPKSVIIMNESFASTTVNDALFLGREILERIIARDCLCVYVTFLDELSRLGPATVSVVSTVVPENPAERTFKLVRRPADGLAYAEAIAEKYGLTYRSLRRRLAR